jgi:hypothetical protein
MEPVVDPLTDVNCDRAHRGDVLGQLLDQVLGCMGDFGHGVEVVIFQMLSVHIPQR